jgi:GLPGLI family protein
MRPAFFLLLLFLAASCYGQERFIHYGVIEFEKRINLQKRIDGNPQWESLRNSVPQFHVSYYNLYFSVNKTLFEKEKENAQVPWPFLDPGQQNEETVFMDLADGTRTTKLKLFEETFLVSDSLRHVDWKITTDTREIAGFPCRKALATIMDSVYVIAFFTEEITVSGGPLSFSGLPGMVLGVAIPRINMTLFATKLQLVEPPAAKLSAPAGNYKRIGTQRIPGMIRQAMPWPGDIVRKYLIEAIL